MIARPSRFGALIRSIASRGLIQVPQRLSAREVAEFARVFPPGPGLSSLLGSAGLPVAKLPVPYGLDAQEFWNLVNDRIGAGLVGDGRQLLLRFATGRFPANEVFSAGLDAVRAVSFVGASPNELPRVRADRELRAVLRAIRGTPIAVRPLLAADAADLGRIGWMSGGERADLLHLCCHCDGEALLFENRDGETHRVPVEDVAAVLRAAVAAAKAPLLGVLLAGCRGERAAEALRPHAHTVVAHRGDLDDDDAVLFAEYFYAALAEGAGPGPAARLAAEQVAADERGRPWLRDGLIVLEGGE